MRQWIRAHLTYANVMATIAVFIALGGGTTAVALNGTNTVQSDDLGPGAQVKAADVADNAVNSADIVNGQVMNPDILNGAVTGAKVADGSLTGADIADRSGVDTCRTPLTVKLGPTCAGSDGVARNLAASINYCAGLGLRLPTWSEAVAMAKNYDVPGVSDVADSFWTDTLTNGSLQQEFGPIVVEEDGNWAIHVAGSRKAVCVTDPSA
jgi:hypothetical protein